MDAATKPALDKNVVPMMPKHDLPPSEQTKRQFLDGLKDILDGLRSDPVHGDAIRRFESLLNLIRKEEESSYMGANPLLVTRDLLTKAGKWLPIQAVTLELNQKDVEAPSTRNARTTASERRPLTNVERLQRLLLQAVNHGKLLGYRTIEGKVNVTYLGLVGWPYPKGVTPIDEARKGKKKK